MSMDIVSIRNMVCDNGGPRAGGIPNHVVEGLCDELEATRSAATGLARALTELMRVMDANPQDRSRRILLPSRMQLHVPPEGGRHPMTPAAAALEYAKVRAAKYWTEKSHPEYPTIDRPTVITLLAEAFAAGYLRAYADEDKDNDSRVLRYPEPEL